MKILKLSLVVLCVGVITGCKTNMAKVFEQLKDDPAEVHLVIDRNGLKLDRTNPGAVSNRFTLTEVEKEKLRLLIDGK